MKNTLNCLFQALRLSSVPRPGFSAHCECGAGLVPSCNVNLQCLPLFTEASCPAKFCANSRLNSLLTVLCLELCWRGSTSPLIESASNPYLRVGVCVCVALAQIMFKSLDLTTFVNEKQWHLILKAKNLCNTIMERTCICGWLLLQSSLFGACGKRVFRWILLLGSVQDRRNEETEESSRKKGEIVIRSPEFCEERFRPRFHLLLHLLWFASLAFLCDNDQSSKQLVPEVFCHNTITATATRYLSPLQRTLQYFSFVYLQCCPHLQLCRVRRHKDW